MDEWCCLKGSSHPACGGAARPLRWQPVTHKLSGEARPESAPFTASVCVCIHTGIKTYTPSQMSANTVARMPAWLPHQGQRHSAAAWWQGTLIKWEPPRSSIQILKKKVCVHISGVLSHRGLGCVCVWMWVRRLLKAFPPTQSAILSIDWRATETRIEAAGWNPGRQRCFPSLVFDFFCLFIHSLVLNNLSWHTSVHFRCFKTPSDAD